MPLGQKVGQGWGGGGAEPEPLIEGYGSKDKKKIYITDQSIRKKIYILDMKSSAGLGTYEKRGVWGA